MAGSATAMMDVFTVIAREGMQKPFWLRVGACFTNRDGSLSVLLDAYPKDGKLQIRSRPQEWDKGKDKDKERERDRERDGAGR
jgi:hypothetical protein